jgi:hypothetical protein
MSLHQNSKVKVRAGLQQNLPQLSKGELGWAIDTQRLFIGNGEVVDGAPYAGNTEISTVPNSLAGSAGYPRAGIPTGIIDGVNKIFTVPFTPIPETLIVFNNIALIPGVGFTAKGNIITYTTAPVVDDKLYYYCWQYLVYVSSNVNSGSSLYGSPVVSGITNGVNTLFSLASFPSQPSALILTLGGIALTQGVDYDYTLSGIDIIMNYAPPTDSILRAYYTI